jgi:hypothetical protein
VLLVPEGLGNGLGAHGGEGVLQVRDPQAPSLRGQSRDFEARVELGLEGHLLLWPVGRRDKSVDCALHRLEVVRLGGQEGADVDRLGSHARLRDVGAAELSNLQGGPLGSHRPHAAGLLGEGGSDASRLVVGEGHAEQAGRRRLWKLKAVASEGVPISVRRVNERDEGAREVHQDTLGG